MAAALVRKGILHRQGDGTDRDRDRQGSSTERAGTAKGDLHRHGRSIDRALHKQVKDALNPGLKVNCV